MSAMIVVAGEALIDLIVHPDGSLAATAGGGPFNTARTIARLDGEVAFLGRLSTDRFGTMLRDALVADGVVVDLVETTDDPTTLAVAELDGHGTATYRFHTAETSAPGLTSAAVERAMARAPAAVHLGTLGLVLEPMAAALEVAALGADPATLVMLDPNCRPQVTRDRAAYLGRLGRMLPRVDVVKVSGDDLAWLSPDLAADDAARTLLDAGPSTILVTHGGRAVSVIGRGYRFDVPVPATHVVDTVGAGDAFGGGFLARWIEAGLGRGDLADAATVAAAVTLAIEVARGTCQRRGADPPSRADAGWPTPRVA
jgi:fructokinase